MPGAAPLATCVHWPTRAAARELTAGDLQEHEFRASEAAILETIGVMSTTYLSDGPSRVVEMLDVMREMMQARSERVAEVRDDYSAGLHASGDTH